jgi:hypothetical protein
MLGKVESAEVVRHVGDRGAFAIQEMINLPDGRSFPKTYTVWASIAPPVGSIVQVTGEVTIKQREYAAPSGMKTAIDINFNNPNVTVMGATFVQAETSAQVAEAIQEIADSTIKELPF